MEIKSNLFLHDFSVSLPTRRWEENYFSVFRKSVTPVILNPDYDAGEFFSQRLIAELRTVNHEMYLLREITATTYSKLIVFEKIMELYSNVPRLNGKTLFELLRKLVSASLNTEEEHEIKLIHESDDYPQIKIEKLNLYLMKLIMKGNNEKLFENIQQWIDNLVNNISRTEVNKALQTAFSKPYKKPDLSKLLVLLVRGLNSSDLTKQLILYSFNAYKSKLDMLLNESITYKKWLYNIGELYPYLALGGLVPDVQLYRSSFTLDELELINKEDKFISELYANIFSIITSVGLGLIEPNFSLYIMELKEKKSKLEQQKKLIFDYKNKLIIPKYKYEELLGALPL